jgi:hypothetical protein
MWQGKNGLQLLDSCARASEIRTHLEGEQTVLLRVGDQRMTTQGLFERMEGAVPSGEDVEVDWDGSRAQVWKGQLSHD